MKKQGAPIQSHSEHEPATARLVRASVAYEALYEAEHPLEYALGNSLRVINGSYKWLYYDYANHAGMLALTIENDVHVPPEVRQAAMTTYDGLSWCHSQEVQQVSQRANQLLQEYPGLLTVRRREDDYWVDEPIKSFELAAGTSPDTLVFHAGENVYKGHDDLPAFCDISQLPEDAQQLVEAYLEANGE